MPEAQLTLFYLQVWAYSIALGVMGVLALDAMRERWMDRRRRASEKLSEDESSAASVLINSAPTVLTSTMQRRITRRAAPMVRHGAQPAERTRMTSEIGNTQAG